jgi:hypothetical protein
MKQRLQSAKYVFGVLAILIICLPSDVSAQQVDSTFWVPNGPVNSLLLHDSTVIIGGQFDQVSPVCGSFARVDTSTAVVDPSLFKVNGTVYCTYRSRQGYLYIGGDFTQAGSQPVENIFRLRPNGTFDNSFVHLVNGPVYCINQHDTDLFIGGNFTQIDGQTRNYFGGIELNTGNVGFCDPNLNGPVYCMAQDTSTFTPYMIIGGAFTNVGGFTPPYLAKIKMSSGYPFLFNAVPWTAVPNVNAPVYDLDIKNGFIYMAGEFTQFASTPRRGLAILQQYSGVLQSTNANITGSVYSMKIIDTNIYIGGSFSSVGSQLRGNLACVDFSFAVQTWNPGTNGVVREIGMADSDEFFIGGNFTVASGDTVGRGAIINRFTGVARNWNPKFNATVYTSGLDTSGRLYIGGAFFGAGGVLRKNLCALSVNSGVCTAWNPSVSSTVRCMTLDGDTLYFAGDFSTVNSTSRGRVAAIDLATSTLLPFNPGVNGIVRTIAVTNTDVFVGGNFTTLGGQPRNNIGEVSKSTSLASTWNPYCYGTVNKLLLDANWLYVAGYYNNIGGEQRQNLARVDRTTGVTDLTWICDTDDGIYQAEFYNGKLALGGWFSIVNGQTANDFALLDTSSLTLAPANFACDGFISTFTTFGDDFFMAGTFNITNAQYQPRLVSYDEGNMSVDPWTPVPDAAPKTMQATATRLYAGGQMTSIGNLFHPFLQVLDVHWVTGVEDIQSSETSFLVYPVPASDFITIESQRNFSAYTITDITGKIVQSGILETSTAGQSVSVAGLSAGMYFLNLSSDNQTASRKIVIQ